MQVKKIAAILFLALGLAACRSDISGDTYAVSETGQMSEVFMGKVITKRAVLIRENKSATDNTGAGTLAGAGTGAIAGSTVGAGRGTGVAMIGGAVVGGVIGNAIENKVGEQKGFEYIILLNDGRSVAVTQGITPTINVDQEVVVIYPGSYNNKRKSGQKSGVTRVIPR